MVDLYSKSIDIIMKNQGENGAYIASPAFPTYHFSWMRDGSYVAYAMDRVGKHDSARKFYCWVDSVIKRYEFKIENIINKLDKGEKLTPGDFLNARYTLDGFEEVENGWGNFQLDAYGTWLWGFSEHIRLTGEYKLIDQFRESIYNTVKYIENLWFYPNYDIWEENGDKIHTTTLACLYGGLNSINRFLKDDNIDKTAKKIKAYILTNCIKDNKFSKYVGNSEVDSSLIWLVVPFDVVELKDPIFLNTVEQIEKDLFHKGGVHRYKQDTYYGGGEWILLSSWLGWYYVELGEIDKAKAILKWVVEQADEEGNLTEQVCKHVNNELYYPYWISKWGQVASPLLWSHAMYLVLNSELESNEKEM